MAGPGITMSEQRAQLQKRFNAEKSWQSGTVAGIPDWFETLLSDLVIAIGEDDIRYFSASYEPNTASMEVIVFTDELVAYATVDLDGGVTGRSFEVTVTARRALMRFSIETEPGFDPDSRSTAGMLISVSYPDFSRTLPLGESEWPDRDSDTSALLRCLRLDVVA